MEFTYRVAFASFLAKAIFSVNRRGKTLHLEKSSKMINAFRMLVSYVDIMLLT